MMNVYEIVTQKILEQLDKGVVPWRRPWKSLTASGFPTSWTNRKPYRGVNLFLLAPGEYLTFKQIQEHGGKVKKGEKSHIVVFYKMMEKEAENEEEETRRFPYLRYYNVFEVDQCEGIERRSPQPEEELKELPPIKRAEFIIRKYENPPKIKHAGGSAYYAPILDEIVLPKKNSFLSKEEYYSTLFHELAHSTGHQARLNRDTLVKNTGSMRSDTYAKEELIAEMTAAMLCGKAMIEQATLENSAAYIDSWRKHLKDDSRLIVTTASKAQKAADYIQGVRWNG